MKRILHSSIPIRDKHYQEKVGLEWNLFNLIKKKGLQKNLQYYIQCERINYLTLE